VGALLFDPGLGKTATVLDYAGLLAIKSPRREARVLVIAPLAAIDTWVMQADTFASPMVNYWAEALGGSLLARAEALASRGGNPHKHPLIPQEPPRPPRWIVVEDNGHETVAMCQRCGVRRVWLNEKIGKDLVFRWWDSHLDDHPEYVRKETQPQLHGPRALHYRNAVAWGARAADRARPITASEGPDGLGDKLPRLIIEVVNIDTLAYRTTVKIQGARGVRSVNMADVMVDAIQRYDPDLVVVDESHKIKSNMGNASRLLARVTKFVKRRIILTGTVMPHGPLDVFGQWRFLEPYAFGDPQPDGSRKQATFGGFKGRYAVQGGWMGKEVVGYQNLDEMQSIMSKNAIVARKKDALDLPAETDVTVPVHLSPTESKAYVEMRDQLVTQLASGKLSSVGSRLTQMLRLRQITSGHLPEDGGSTKIIGTSKVATIKSLVHDTLAGEKRIVIFAYFSAEIDMLEKALTQKGTEVMTISGGTPNAERLRLRKRFGPEGPQNQRIVLVAQIKTLSLAVNELITANHAIFGSLSQQRDDLIQARDRLARIGQTRPMTFWYAVAPGTVDEVILQSHRDRTNLEDAMLKHIQHGPSLTHTLNPRNDPLVDDTIGDAMGMAGFR
jgi:hypothetical protein